MKTSNAIRCALILSGRYNSRTDTVTVKGTDLHGEPTEITVPALDGAALERDVQAILGAAKVVKP